jgi:hypothetical protein
MKRTRYQKGSLRLYERKKGDQAWEYRWYETQLDGKRGLWKNIQNNQR